VTTVQPRFHAHISPKDDLAGEPLVVGVQENQILVGEDERGLHLPAAPPAGGNVHILGSLGDRPCVAVDCNDEPPPPSLKGVGLRELYGLIPEGVWGVAGRAVQIVAWDRNHRFCGRCATPTEPQPGERERRCPACGLSSYPPVTPAIIVLVTRGEHDEEALLAWGRRHRGRHYSTLAGFVEPGEGLEEAVMREVFEETAIEVTQIEYFGSQPWPFPSQLMVGLRARYAAGEIAIQESEIVEARWFRSEQLERETASRGSFSIAGWLIDGWLAEQPRPITPRR